MNDVFLSYSSKNEESAEALRSVLEQGGLSVWMANHAIDGGEDFSAAIAHGLEECRCFVLLLTEEAQASPWVPKEVDSAISAGKPIVPVQLTQVALTDGFKFSLVNAQIVTLPCIDYNDAANQKLITTIKARMAGKRVFSLPKKGDSPVKWAAFLVPLVAVVAAVTILMSSLLAKPDSKGSDYQNQSNDMLNTFMSQVGNMGNGTQNMDNVTQAKTLQPPVVTDINQIPEQFEDEVEAVWDTTSELKHLVVEVGEYITPPAAGTWDCYIYSQDSRIAIGEGRRVKAVAPGSTYIVVADKGFYDAGTAYRITVTAKESDEPVGVNEIPEELMSYVEVLKASDEATITLNTVKVRKGKTATLNAVWNNGVAVYSADTGIVIGTGTGSIVKGVSVGTTYVVLRTSTGTTKAYRVLVEE